MILIDNLAEEESQNSFSYFLRIYFDKTLFTFLLYSFIIPIRNILSVTFNITTLHMFVLLNPC